MFALGLVQGEWKMYVNGPLDREERHLYIINVTATDGLFVSQATVEVSVIDTNDNSPTCDQVRPEQQSVPLMGLLSVCTLSSSLCHMIDVFFICI